MPSSTSDSANISKWNRAEAEEAKAAVAEWKAFKEKYDQSQQAFIDEAKQARAKRSALLYRLGLGLPLATIVGAAVGMAIEPHTAYALITGASLAFSYGITRIAERLSLSVETYERIEMAKRSSGTGETDQVALTTVRALLDHSKGSGGPTQ